jgi:proline iminopeptidase
MKSLVFISGIFLFGFAMCGCTQRPTNEFPDLRSYLMPKDTGLQTGGIKMITVETPKGSFRVWTKTIGNNPKARVLLLHGGPGATHDYFECFENFLPAEGIEFIYYDQIGSGDSENPGDTSLWNLPRFVEEVEQVRAALGLANDNFYLLGHSWGGILAMEYALKYQHHLKGLIIANMMASCPAYGKYADSVLAKQMDPSVLDTIRMLESNGDYSNPKYMELLMPNFYAQHILRMPPEEWPFPVVKAFNRLNQQVYVIMQGPSEFGISGKLELWDRSAELKNISVPTLVIGARHDTMDPNYMEWMSKQVQNGSYLYCPNGSHLCMFDDQKTFFNGLIRFLHGVEEGKQKEII